MYSINNEPIAIIGTGCRFPGNANSPSKLWNLLKNPQELSEDIPSSRFKSNAFYHPDGAHHGTSNVQKGYFLEDDIRRFDNQFFSISTAEAESMDAQQRQLLEIVFEALESANLKMEEMRGSATAVYVGLMCDDYSGLIFSDMESVPTYGATGAARSILSNRVSYFYDWTGPSYTIDSACSSSLVAVHQAVQQLRSRECSVALAAGANLILSPRMFVAESKLKMLSPNGHSRMWDANGDGYARGEGIAALLLKRLSDAIADGDHIQCIIRETHVNQGGRSTGLTVPNPVAQVNLIQETYAKAGLDLNNLRDRPQYFQAHGTGTKVGDLQEATAIHNTFFNSGMSTKHKNLYVGSVKTIIGHSEGAAGIAGLLEASLAVEYGVIPPNLHFETLNPHLEPFYDRLEVPTKATQWPITIDGIRRASVNSFGFGGTNAHVIVENYVSSTLDNVPVKIGRAMSIPFTFSAASDRSLNSLLSNYSEYLTANPETDLIALAWTLLTRRSIFAHRISFLAQTPCELRIKLDTEIEASKRGLSLSIVSRPLNRPKIVLGIFTGQGAQWATMGWDLISASTKAMTTLQCLESSLGSLPLQHRPSWSLQTELSPSASTSRVQKAAISQPLCTAVQIILVDYLYELGARFSAVVGHSSGEIGAAYAAGFITADAAIKIAYYRGYFANLAGSGMPGAMLAVSISNTDANELCQLPSLRGRISVAADNSSTSVTLSGDSDAINQAKSICDERSIFARILKVGVAYHSSHMLPCSEPYLQALQECHIQIQQGHEDCIWFSSVNHGRIMSATESLQGRYWMNNMLRPVLFSQALTQASTTLGIVDFVLEVGPHPALKGPVVQILREINSSNKVVPYSGLLYRGNSGVDAFAEALGMLWTSFGSEAFDPHAYDKLFRGNHMKRLLQDLPTYPWDHDRVFWYESRSSREYRLRSDAPHELLGIKASDQAEGQHSWRNYLRSNEIPWLQGHKIQGQIVFPAAAYIIMAMEAANIISIDRDVSLIEMQDLNIVNAISISDDSTGMETLFSVRGMEWDKRRTRMMADFTCHACLSKDTGSLVLVCSGKLIILAGEQRHDVLPSSSVRHLTDLRDVDVNGFYDTLAAVGYGYTGPFRSISSLQQKLDISTGTIRLPKLGGGDSQSEITSVIHPASLDAAIQTLFACLGTPGDGSLWALHVPVSIERVRINPSMCGDSIKTKEISFQSQIIHPSAGTRGVLLGEVMLYSPDVESGAMLQMEGMQIKSLMPATPADDRHLFSHLTQGVAEPDISLVCRQAPLLEAEIKRAEQLEKLCLFYFKQLDDFVRSLTVEEVDRVTWHGKQILASASSVLAATKAGQHETCKTEWLQDTWKQLQYESVTYKEDPDCKLINAVGSNLIPFILNKTTILEHMMHDGLLNSYYQSSELLEYNEYAGRLAAQISFRYPLIRVLEIGAGTGGVTRTVLRHLDAKYGSYTFTDISTAFFEQARETFGSFSKVKFEALDIETDPTTQGFEDRSYDVIVASNVLHATRNLHVTLSNTRRLLKPGGKLLVLEAVNNGCARVGFSFCGVPGWWAAEDGRIGGPLLTVGKWGELLERSGFSGFDTATPGAGDKDHPVVVFVSTAVDSEMDMLRAPLSFPYQHERLNIGSVVIVGGVTQHLCEGIQDILIFLEPWSNNIQVVKSLDEFDLSRGATACDLVHVLNLSELDAPFFKNLTPQRFDALKRLLNYSRSFVWVTSGARALNPYSSMVVGMGRALVHEMPHVRVQVLDLGDSSHSEHKEEMDNNIRLVAEAFLRVILVDKWGNGIGEGLGTRTWSNEVELWLSNGRWEVVRATKETEANARLMSQRRLIEEITDVENESSEAVNVVARDDGHYSLRKQLQETNKAESSNDTKQKIQVTHSTLLAIRFGNVGYLHVVIGKDIKDGTKVIALSRTMGSTISTSMCWRLPWPVISGQEAATLSVMCWEVMAETILEAAKKDKTLILFEPTVELANVVASRALFASIKLCFITADAEKQGYNWVYIHPLTSKRELKTRLPRDIGVFVDCSASGEPHLKGLLESVKTHLPVFCRKLDVSDLYRQSPMIDSEVPLNSAGNSLRIAAINALSALSASDKQITATTITANELSALKPDDVKPRIINWTTDTKVRIQIQSAEDMMHFRSAGTYLLIGLTGNLGRSLCRWMISRGAKHIVLASRNPDVEDRWREEMEELGGKILIMAMDISNQASLKSTIKIIETTLPPIVGVANAAMVLSDTLLANMSFNELQAVLKPKVDGSRFLSSIFSQSSSHKLDFFILFGSSVDIMSNSGQSAYCAANMFMHGLIYSRRKHGLVGSLIGLGEVKGVGYAARREKEGGGKLNRIIGDTLPLSEREVLAMFAEGILAGKFGENESYQNRNPVLYAGMVGRDPMVEKGVTWYEHAKFWHYIETSNDISLSPSTHNLDSVSENVKKQLALASSPEQVQRVVSEAFIQKLKRKLQMSDADVVDESKVLLEFGIDSLVAVDLRAWFVIELGIDMPILRILGGGSVSDVVVDAVGRLSSSMIPGVAPLLKPKLLPNGLGGMDVIRDVQVDIDDIGNAGTGTVLHMTSIIAATSQLHSPVSNTAEAMTFTLPVGVSGDPQLSLPSINHSETGVISTVPDPDSEGVGLKFTNHVKADSVSSSTPSFESEFMDVSLPMSPTSSDDSFATGETETGAGVVLDSKLDL